MGKRIKKRNIFSRSDLKVKKRPVTRSLFCSTYGIRTRDSSVKGRRLNPLTNAPFPLKDRKDKVGIICFLIFYFIFIKIFFQVQNNSSESDLKTIRLNMLNTWQARFTAELRLRNYLII